MKARLWKWLVWGLLLVCTAAWVYDTLYCIGAFRSVEDRFTGKVHKVQVPGLVGVEDITIDQEKGVAYLSATDRRSQREGGKPQGGIFRWDLSDPKSVPQRISEADADFAPHGLSLLALPNGERELYVIDHGTGENRVQRYRIEGLRLDRIQTYESTLLVSPNDVAAVGQGRFYVTNDHFFTAPALRMLEDYLRLPLSQMVYFDQGQARTVASDMAYGNGVSWHAQRQELFVAVLGANEVRAYRAAPDGNLHMRTRFAANAAVDNIEIGSDGYLWIGAHPKPLQFAAHARSAQNLSASQVLRMDPQSGSVTVVYENRGQEMSGSSVGAQWHDRLLIGSVFEPFVLDAHLPPVEH